QNGEVMTGTHQGYKFLSRSARTNLPCRGRFAGCEGPGVLDLESLHVELDEGTLVLEIDEDFALPVCRAELRATAEREGADEFSRGSVDGRCRVGIAIEGEDALGKWIVDDSVRVFVRLDLVQDFQRGEIEDGGIGVAAVGGKAFVEFVGEGDAVGSLGTWNVADDFALIGIHNNVVRAAGDE